MAVSSAGAAAPPPRSPLDVAYSLTCYPETTDPAGAEPIRVDPGGRIEANVILHAVPALHILFQVKEHDPKQGFGGLGLQQSVFGFSDFVPVNQSFQQQGNGNDPGPVTVEISGVAPGQYELEFPGSNPSQETAHAASIQVSSGDLAVDASQLQPRASVSGKVIVPGEGDLPANSSVLLVNAQGEARGSGPLDAAGNFQMRDIPPGKYGVQLAGNGVNLAVTQLQVKGARTDGPILEVANDPIELAVMAARPVGAINGFVTRNGKPASGIFVLLVEPKFAASRYGWLPNQSDSDGSFTFPGLLPGQYIVVAIEQGWTLDWRQPSVIDPYLAKGVQVTVEASSKKIDLQTPLEAQKIGGPASQ